MFSQPPNDGLISGFSELTGYSEEEARGWFLGQISILDWYSRNNEKPRLD